jgi:predicted nucleic-acid-binding protein
VIAIDTNVLIRRLVRDDVAQAATVDRLFDTHPDILIIDVVLAEAVWTLAGKRYCVGKRGLVDAVTSLLEEPTVVFESRQAVWSALNDFDQTDGVDFADALIVRKARNTAERTARTYGGTYTFDKAALALAGMVAL